VSDDEIQPDAESNARAAAEETDATEASRPRPGPAEPKAPGSAASRARRIGGRPAVPAAPSATNLEKSRPAPPPPGTGRHATPPAPPKTKPVKAAKAASAASGSSEASATSPLVQWIPTAVLAAAAVVLLVLIAVAGHGVYYAKSSVSDSARTANQQAAVAAAKSCIATINTYDYRTLTKNEAAALACVTGPFTAKLKTTYTKTLLPEAPVAKATQTAQVNLAGVKSVSSDGTQIQVLLYGQFAVTNVQTASTGTPRYDVFGIVATMNKVAGKWLVAAYVSDTGDSAGK